MGALPLGLNGCSELVGLGSQPVGLGLDLGLERVGAGLPALERIDPSGDSARPLRCELLDRVDPSRGGVRVLLLELLASLRESPPE